MTRFGAWVLVVTVALTALGAAVGDPGLAVPGATGLLVVVVTGAWALRRPAVSVERRIEPPLVAKGEAAEVSLEVQATSRRSPRLVLDQRVGAEVVRIEAPARRVTVATALPTARRGRLELGPVEVVRADPFGLWHRAQAVTGTDELLVTPRVVALRPLPAGRSASTEGPASDRSPNGTTTFHRLRHYEVGDDLRLVHWPATARTGSLVVRQHVDTAETGAAVIVDTDASAYHGDGFEHAVDMAASVVSSLVSAGSRVGVHVGSAPAVDAASATAALTTATTTDAGACEPVVAAAARRRGTSALVVLTGQPSAPLLAALGAASRVVATVVLVTVTDAGVPAPPGVVLVVGADVDQLARSWARATRRAVTAGRR